MYIYWHIGGFIWYMIWFHPENQTNQGQLWLWLFNEQLIPGLSKYIYFYPICLSEIDPDLSYMGQRINLLLFWPQYGQYINITGKVTLVLETRPGQFLTGQEVTGQDVIRQDRAAQDKTGKQQVNTRCITEQDRIGQGGMSQDRSGT